MLSDCQISGGRTSKWKMHSPEEVHASCKGDNIGKADNSLTLEKFPRHHGVWRKFPLPDHPSSDEGDTEEECAQDVRAVPIVSIATGVESNQAVIS